MSGLLPIVEELADCETHAERVEWLFSCPLSVLSRDEADIRTVLQVAGFRIGLNYLDAQLMALRSVRGSFGIIDPDIQGVVAALTASLAITAELSREEAKAAE